MSCYESTSASERKSAVLPARLLSLAANLLARFRHIHLLVPTATLLARQRATHGRAVLFGKRATLYIARRFVIPELQIRCGRGHACARTPSAPLLPRDRACDRARSHGLPQVFLR